MSAKQNSQPINLIMELTYSLTSSILQVTPADWDITYTNTIDKIRDKDCTTYWEIIATANKGAAGSGGFDVVLSFPAKRYNCQSTFYINFASALWGSAADVTGTVFFIDSVVPSISTPESVTIPQQVNRSLVATVSQVAADSLYIQITGIAGVGAGSTLKIKIYELRVFGGD
jgi:hypothetical protein